MRELVWLIPALLGYPSVPLLQDHPSGSAAWITGWVLLGTAIIAFGFAIFRLVTSSRAARRYRKDHASDVR